MNMSFFEASGIEEWCRSADQALRNAFDEAHSRATITRLDRHLLTPSAADRFVGGQCVFSDQRWSGVVQ